MVYLVERGRGWLLQLNWLQGEIEVKHDHTAALLFTALNEFLTELNDMCNHTHIMCNHLSVCKRPSILLLDEPTSGLGKKV